MAHMAESQVHVFRKKLAKLQDHVDVSQAPGDAGSLNFDPEANPNAGQDVLFREFFSTTFSRTLAQVKDVKKLEFAQELAKYLTKFDPVLQQPYLECLVTFLLKGRDTVECTEKARECVQKVLSRVQLKAEMVLPGGLDGIDITGNSASTAQQELKEFLPEHTGTHKAIKEIAGQAFTQVWSVLKRDDQILFTKTLLSKIYEVDLSFQREIVSKIEPARDFVEKEIILATTQFNTWLKRAPRYPATPLVLGDLFHMCLTSRNCPLYRAIGDKVARERFLISISLLINLVLNDKGPNSWLTLNNPCLRRQAYDLQQKFFNVQGNIIMGKWLDSRLETFNKELVQHMVDRPALDVYMHLSPLFHAKMKPASSSSSATDGAPANKPGDWEPVEKRREELEGILLDFVEKYLQDRWFCPRHVLQNTAMLKVFAHYGLIELNHNSQNLRILPRRSFAEQQGHHGAGAHGAGMMPAAYPGGVHPGGVPPGPPFIPGVQGPPGSWMPGPNGGMPGVYGAGAAPHAGPGGGPPYPPGPGYPGQMQLPPHLAGGYHGYHGPPGGKGNKGAPYPPGAAGAGGGKGYYAPGAGGPGGAHHPPFPPGGPGGMGVPGGYGVPGAYGGGPGGAGGPGHEPRGVVSKAVPPGAMPGPPGLQHQIGGSSGSSAPQTAPARPKHMTLRELDDMHCENLVDLLVRETFIYQMRHNGLSEDTLALTKVPQIEHTWMICGIEVTFRTEEGKLFVYKSNSATRNVNVEHWIENDMTTTLIAKGIKPPTKGVALQMGETGITTKVVAGPGEEPPPMPEGDVVLDPVSGMMKTRTGIIFSTRRPGEPDPNSRDAGVDPPNSSGDRGLRHHSSGNPSPPASANGPVVDHSPNKASVLDNLDDAVFTEQLWEDQSSLGKLIAHLVKKGIVKKEWTAYCERFGFTESSQQDPKRHTADTLRLFLQDQIKADAVSGEKDIVHSCETFLRSKRGGGRRKRKREEAGSDDDADRDAKRGRG